MPRPVHLLLINPRYPESFWSFRWALERVLTGKRALNPPLGLATLAALCPAHWQVTIVDENIESIPLSPEADLVGICGMGVQHDRQVELLHYYRGKGYATVAGGSFASLCPERYADSADHVVAGEAEYIWKRFCADFEQCQPARLYREEGNVDLHDSPTPRFDLLKLDRYTSATLQFSRGCPYLCEFCDIIVMFGRRPRHKSLPQVERELDALRKQGVRSIFFVDDNLIGNRAVARDLLIFLRNYQDRHGAPFRFGTEASLNVARDEELLTLLHAAGFEWLFVGIESADPATLKATRKTQNLHEDVLTSVHRIQARGIDVLGGFIVGFDQDTTATFEQQYRFITDSGIQAAMVGLLTALPRTPLHERLRREGRLLESDAPLDNTRPWTNVIPKSMTQTELIRGYETLYRRLLSDGGIAARVRNRLCHLGAQRFDSEYPWMQSARLAWRVIVRGILPGGWRRVLAFAGSLPWRRPNLMQAAFADWVCGLSMRDYVDRRFGSGETDGQGVTVFRRALRAIVARHRAGSQVRVEVDRARQGNISLELRDIVSAELITPIGRRLEQLLGNTRLSVTLRLRAIRVAPCAAIERMLARLRRFGDRVVVDLDEPLRARIAVDSSVFRVVMR